MKKLLSLMLTMAVAMTMFVMPVNAAGKEMTTSEFKTAYAVATGEYKLTEDVVITDKFNFQENAVIDLGGFTLALKVSDSYVTGIYSVTIKNGTIDLSETNNASNGIICIGEGYNGADGTLVLDNVDVIGTDISSGAGTFFLYENSVLRMINGTAVTITNEGSSAAYIIYCNDGLGATVEITDSSITSTDANSGLFNGNVTIDNSTLDLDVKDNGINGFTSGMELKVIDSEVTVENGAGRALSLAGTSNASFVNSEFTSKNNAEAAILYKSGATGKVTADKNSTIVMEGNVKLSVADKPNLTPEEYADYIATENKITVEADGTIVIKPEQPAATETPAATGEHVWGYNTQYDAAAHWDYCHVCGAQNTPVAHSDANGDGVCDCGWVLANTPSRVNPNTGVTADMLK